MTENNALLDEMVDQVMFGISAGFVQLWQKPQAREWLVRPTVWCRYVRRDR